MFFRLLSTSICWSGISEVSQEEAVKNLNHKIHSTHPVTAAARGRVVTEGIQSDATAQLSGSLRSRQPPCAFPPSLSLLPSFLLFSSNPTTKAACARSFDSVSFPPRRSHGNELPVPPLLLMSPAAHSHHKHVTIMLSAALHPPQCAAGRRQG